MGERKKLREGGIEGPDGIAGGFGVRVVFGDMGSLWKGWGLKCFIHNRLPEASGQIVEEMGYGKIKWKVCV